MAGPRQRPPIVPMATPDEGGGLFSFDASLAASLVGPQRSEFGVPQMGGDYLPMGDGMSMMPPSTPQPEPGINPFQMGEFSAQQWDPSKPDTPEGPQISPLLHRQRLMADLPPHRQAQMLDQERMQRLAQMRQAMMGRMPATLTTRTSSGSRLILDKGHMAKAGQHGKTALDIIDRQGKSLVDSAAKKAALRDNYFKGKVLSDAAGDHLDPDNPGRAEGYFEDEVGDAPGLGWAGREGKTSDQGKKMRDGDGAIDRSKQRMDARMKAIEEYKAEMSDVMSLMQEAAKKQPDPNRWWNDNTGWQKTRHVLGMALMGMSGAKGLSSALGFVNKQIARDVAIQQKSLDRQFATLKMRATNAEDLLKLNKMQENAQLAHEQMLWSSVQSQIRNIGQMATSRDAQMAAKAAWHKTRQLQEERLAQAAGKRVQWSRTSRPNPMRMQMMSQLMKAQTPEKKKNLSEKLMKDHYNLRGVIGELGGIAALSEKVNSKGWFRRAMSKGGSWASFLGSDANMAKRKMESLAIMMAVIRSGGRATDLENKKTARAMVATWDNPLTAAKAMHDTFRVARMRTQAEYDMMKYRYNPQQLDTLSQNMAALQRMEQRSMDLIKARAKSAGEPIRGQGLTLGGQYGRDIGRAGARQARAIDRVGLRR